jgi:hypothetical protein
MSNPLPNEKELYAKIEKEKLKIPQCIWELLYHHLGNDLYAISLIAESHVTGQDKEPIPVEDGLRIISHVEQIKELLEKMQKLGTLQ